MHSKKTWNMHSHALRWTNERSHHWKKKQLLKLHSYISATSVFLSFFHSLFARFVSRSPSSLRHFLSLSSQPKPCERSKRPFLSPAFFSLCPSVLHQHANEGTNGTQNVGSRTPPPRCECQQVNRAAGLDVEEVKVIPSFQAPTVLKPGKNKEIMSAQRTIIINRGLNKQIEKWVWMYVGGKFNWATAFEWIRLCCNCCWKDKRQNTSAPTAAFLLY